MHGVTTVIVAFILVCIIYPRLIRNKPQYYSAAGAILLVILLDSIAQMTDPASAFRIFAYVMTGLLQIGAILLLMMSAGGMTGSELRAELSGAYEVIRRGEEGKEVIIPLSGQRPRRRADEEEEDLPRTYHIESPDPDPEPETDRDKS